MDILEEFHAVSHNAFTLLKVELVLDVVDPWVGAWAADEYKIARLKVTWSQLPGRTNREPVARVATQPHECVHHHEVGVRGKQRTRQILHHSGFAARGVSL